MFVYEYIKVAWYCVQIDPKLLNTSVFSFSILHKNMDDLYTSKMAAVLTAR